MLASILSGFAVVVALIALWVAGHCWLNAPGARLWAQLRLRIEDLEADNEAIHARHHRSARQENVAKATAARVTKAQERSDVVAEAEAVLASSAAPAKPRLVPPPNSEEAMLARIRATFLP